MLANPVRAEGINAIQLNLKIRYSIAISITLEQTFFEAELTGNTVKVRGIDIGPALPSEAIGYTQYCINSKAITFNCSEIKNAINYSWLRIRLSKAEEVCIPSALKILLSGSALQKIIANTTRKQNITSTTYQPVVAKLP